MHTRAPENRTLAAEPLPRRERHTPLSALAALLPQAVLWAGLALTLCRTCPSVSAPWWAVAAAGLALSAVCTVLLASPVRRWVLPGGLVLTAILTAALFSPVSGGLRLMANDVLKALTAVTGRIRLERAAGESALPGLIPILTTGALLISASADGAGLWPLLPFVLPVLAGTAAGVVPADSDWLLLAAGVLLLCGIGAGRSAGAGLLRVGTLAVCALAALGCLLALRGTDASALRERTADRIHTLRFDSKTNSMPEGALKNLGPWRPTDAAALEVTMEEPQKLYLRGHVYEVYTGTGWEEIPGEELADQAPLYYWLHRSGFYPQSQIALAMETAGLGQRQRVTVKNLSACSENAYLPYAFAEPGLLDPAVIGDGRAARTVTDFAVFSGSLPVWYEAQYALVTAQAEPDTAAYLALEQSYADYAREKDLQLTRESWSALARQLGESGGQTLFQIQNVIRDYLETHMHYDASVYTMSGGGDFLHYVLEQSGGGGYSVHYATAAALMLRYFGVPARYVEGYYLTPEQASALAAGETVTLTEKNAHAWAEYYLNGVGFVPFEVTPGYVDPEDLDLGEVSGGDGPMSTVYEAPALAYAELEEPDVEPPEVGRRDAIGLSPWALLGLIPLALLALLIPVLLRRRRLRRRLREIDEADDRSAVALRYGYAMALRQRADGLLLPGEDEEAALLNEQALFSRREMTGEDRARMDAYARRVLQKCREKWGFFRKLRLRLIDAIY